MMSKKAPIIGEEQPVEILPSPLEFLLETPLYKKYQLGKEHEGWVNSIKFISGPLDAYCIYCDDRSLFHKVESEVIIQQSIAGKGFFDVRLNCARVSSHYYYFTVRVYNYTVQKIGQYPSVADISIPQMVKYRGLLGSERYREFTKAIGLAAHGIGIGSFVYLRRVLESLIEDAHEEAKITAGWNEDAYQRSRIVEKIPLLKDHLPEFMVRHRSIYGILSKGIHELSEDECKRYFIPIKSAIELILNEHMIALEYKKNIEDAEKALAGIHEELAEG